MLVATLAPFREVFDSAWRLTGPNDLAGARRGKKTLRYTRDGSSMADFTDAALYLDFAGPVPKAFATAVRPSQDMSGACTLQRTIEFLEPLAVRRGSTPGSAAAPPGTPRAAPPPRPRGARSGS